MPDTIIIFLEDGQSGFNLDPMTILPDPRITQLTSQSGLYHIASNLEIQRVAEILYQSNCKTESKAIKNWQNMLAMASDGMSLEPYFDKGLFTNYLFDATDLDTVLFFFLLKYIWRQQLR